MSEEVLGPFLANFKQSLNPTKVYFEMQSTTLQSIYMLCPILLQTLGTTDAGKDDFSKPENEALCYRIYSTRSQRRLGWK